MRSPNRRPSGRNSRFALFLLLTCFTDDRITRSRFGMETFGPPRRFSAWLRWSCRCAQLHQNGRHHSANLCQGQNRSPMLPGPIDPGEQGTSEHQLVVRACHDLRPAFRLLWSAQTWPIPQQDLLVQSVAMLLRVPQPVRWANLSQRRGFVLLAFPDKPAHLGITPTLAGSMPDHPDHADLDPPRCPQMQLVPAMNLNPLAVSIRALPTGIWFAVCARVAATSTALHPCGWPHADQAGERGRGDKRPDWL